MKSAVKELMTMSDNMSIPQSTDLFVRSLPFWEHLESEQKHLISIGSTTVDYKKGEKLVDGQMRGASIDKKRRTAYIHHIRRW